MTTCDDSGIVTQLKQLFENDWQYSAEVGQRSTWINPTPPLSGSELVLSPVNSAERLANVVRMRDVGQRQVMELRFRVTQDLAKLAIHAQEVAVQRHVGNADGRLFKGRAKTLSVSRKARSARSRALTSTVTSWSIGRPSRVLRLAVTKASSFSPVRLS